LHLPNPNADKANNQEGKSLEALLATKNKRLQEELTKFRVGWMFCVCETSLSLHLQILHGELEASLQVLEKQLETSTSELKRQKMLNEKLETDLLAMDDHKMNGNAFAEGEPDPLANLDLGNKLMVTKFSFLSQIKFQPLHQGYISTYKSSTLHLFRRYVHSSHCHKSARPVQATECRT
jgi:homeobox protein cut-like